MIVGRAMIADRAEMVCRVERQAGQNMEVKLVTCFLILPVGLGMLVVSLYYPEERNLLSHSQSHQVQ